MIDFDGAPSSLEGVQHTLEKRYPGHVFLLHQGSLLYHHSRNPEDILATGRFDPDKSKHAGTFFFTDLPATNANIQIATQMPLLLFEYKDLTGSQLAQIFGDEGYNVGAEKLGFHGFRKKWNSMYVPDDAFEIQIFPSGLSAFVGGIAPYRGVH